MRQFRWLADGPIPAAFDLRRIGWSLRGDAPAAADEDGCPLLSIPGGLAPTMWLALTGAPRRKRRMTAMLGIADPAERSRLLRMKFGDALGWDLSLDELGERITRMMERAAMVERHREVGALNLDLLTRDGYVAGRRLGLHPREFELLWRLAEEPGEAIPVVTLLREVWQLSFLPETNSLAVHVSRLRAKLRLAGLDGVVETAPNGAYRLVARGGSSHQLALDGNLRFGKEPA